MMKTLKKLAAIGLPIAMGLLVLIIVVSRRQPPVREEVVEQALPVRVMTARETRFVPRVTGYGTVKPDPVWQAIAEVRGRVVAVHPELEVGALLPEGTTLLQIDPAEYEISVMRARASVTSAEAQLLEWDLERENLEKRLALEHRNLRLSEREQRRNLALVRDGSVSESVMEQIERDVVRQELQVTTLENSLKSWPARRDQLQAQLDQNKASLRDAERLLEKTEITAPFDCRVAVRSIEVGQAVSTGMVLLELHGRERVELEAGIALEKVVGILGKSEGLVPTEGVSAEVRLDRFSWRAALSRIDASLDPSTRTVGVIVTVDQPYAGTGGRPPLVAGVFCEVILEGAPRQSIAIPRAALSANRVNLADDQNRLQIREVETGSGFGEVVEIKAGLSAGDRIIVSDVAPAVVGRLLEPREDEALAQRVTREAGGTQ